MEDCMPLKLIDKGTVGVLDEADKIQIQAVVENKKSEQISCQAKKKMDSKVFFSSKFGDQSPLDRLKMIIDSNPGIKNIQPKLFSHILKEHRTWMQKMTGHN